MGLSLHYQLRLPMGTPREDVHRILVDMRQFAATLNFEEVSPVVDLANPKDGLEMRWLATAEFHSRIAAVRFEPDVRPDADPDAFVDLVDGDPMTGQVFVILPGEGCEPATFGFLERWNQPKTGRELSWECHCKTQYAANVSEEHFLSCHMHVVRVLDHAKSLGVAVDVEDDGGYWVTRSEGVLVDELRQSRGILAQFAETLSGGRAIEATILER